jgi:hypothetical protein
VYFKEMENKIFEINKLAVTQRKKITIMSLKLFSWLKIQIKDRNKTLSYRK